MSVSQKLSALAIAGAVTSAVGLLIATQASPAQAESGEKCYGVSKAGHNDCQTANSSCAGTSKKDGDKSAFLIVPKGTCEKLAYGDSKSS